MDIDTERIVKETESIKLFINSKGTYTWEIKVLGLDLEKLEKTNSKMVETYRIDLI